MVALGLMVTNAPPPSCDRAHEAHRLRVGRVDTGEDDEAEPAGPDEFVGGAHGVGVTLGAHEERPFVPERAGDGTRAVDPRRAIAVSDRLLARGAEDRGGAAPGLANGELAQGEAAVGERAVQCGYPGRNRLGRAAHVTGVASRKRCSINARRAATWGTS